MLFTTLKSVYASHKETTLFGRYIHSDSITSLLKKLNPIFKVDTIGKSVNELPIYSITFGSGSTKILMWSQMHGNESTTTKAVFDLLNVMIHEKELVNPILQSCTIKIIPILNPDGARAYTRLNANAVDLNRDAQDLSQPESRVLRSVFDLFKPNYCFNLHGQRTIFSAGSLPNPATVSFLAPAQDQLRTLTPTRKIAMQIISKLNDNLQQQIKGQVGIYDDTFNINCVGDTFQSANVPTLLFEAGHYPHDYDREHVREFIFQSLLLSLDYISKYPIEGSDYESYFNIPENQKCFYDIIIRNAKGLDIGIQYHETLIGDKLYFIPKIEKISNLNDFFGHREIQANGHQVFDDHGEVLEEGFENDFVLINDEKFSLKPIKSRV